VAKVVLGVSGFAGAEKEHTWKGLVMEKSKVLENMMGVNQREFDAHRVNLISMLNMEEMQADWDDREAKKMLKKMKKLAYANRILASASWNLIGRS
jgi:hypothetical protein